MNTLEARRSLPRGFLVLTSQIQNLSWNSRSELEMRTKHIIVCESISSGQVNWKSLFPMFGLVMTVFFAVKMSILFSVAASILGPYIHCAVVKFFVDQPSGIPLLLRCCSRCSVVLSLLCVLITF